MKEDYNHSLTYLSDFLQSSNARVNINGGVGLISVLFINDLHLFVFASQYNANA